jgi:hypothetical protein
METRISVTVTKGGGETFTIEKKGEFYPWYFYLIPILGWAGFLTDKYTWQNVYSYYDPNTNEFNRLDEAKSAIDKYIKTKEIIKFNQENSKIVKKYYLKHP